MLLLLLRGPGWSTRCPEPELFKGNDCQSGDHSILQCLLGEEGIHFVLLCLLGKGTPCCKMVSHSIAYLCARRHTEIQPFRRGDMTSHLFDLKLALSPLFLLQELLPEVIIGCHVGGPVDREPIH